MKDLTEGQTDKRPEYRYHTATDHGGFQIIFIFLCFHSRMIPIFAQK